MGAAIDDGSPSGNVPLFLNSHRVLFCLEQFGLEQIGHPDDPFEDDCFHASQLSVGAEHVREHGVQKTAGAGVLQWQVRDEIEIEADLLDDFQGQKGFGRRRSQDTVGAGGVKIHVEFGGGSDISIARNGASDDDDPIDMGNDARISLHGTGDSRQRSEAQDRHASWIGLDPIDDEFFAGHQVLAIDAGETQVTESIGAVEFGFVEDRSVLGIGSEPDAWEPWRIEFFDQRLDILCGLVGRDCSGAGRYGDYIESRIEQSDDQCDGVIDSWVTIDNDFFRHIGSNASYVLFFQQCSGRYLSSLPSHSPCGLVARR
jgi:hypothetical protein